MAQGVQLPYGIDPVNPVFVDVRMGPYVGANENEAKAAALSAINSAVRLRGLQVILVINGVAKIYWFRDGILDTSLIEYLLDIDSIQTVIDLKSRIASLEETINNLPFG